VKIDDDATARFPLPARMPGLVAFFAARHTSNNPIRCNGEQMRFLIKFKIPTVAGDMAVADHHFGPKMHAVLEEIGAEAAYFTAVDGHRGGYIVVNIKDASKIPSIAEPFFLWFNATVEFMPVMLPEDLQKAGPSIAAAVKKWSPKRK
jgi:hypothetical protein